MHSTEPSHQCPNPGLVTFSDFITKHSCIDPSERNNFISRYSLTHLFTYLLTYYYSTCRYESCRTKYDELKAALTTPDGTPAFIVPAFLELIKELNAKKVSYSIIFRTFGDDILQLVSEWNAFVTRYSFTHSRTHSRTHSLTHQRIVANFVNNALTESWCFVLSNKSTIINGLRIT